MRNIGLLACCFSLLATSISAQEPGDSVRLMRQGDSTWVYGRVLTAAGQELVVGDITDVEVFNRRIIVRLERFRRRRAEWVIGTWALGGLAAGALVAALTADDATTEDVVVTVVAGTGVGIAAGFLDFRFRPGGWVVVPPP